MLLNSVTLVLQETLEAALLISVLMNISRLQSHKMIWIPLSLCGGLALAFIYATQMARISNWFDYLGQEIVNAMLQILIALLIAVCSWALTPPLTDLPHSMGRNKSAIFITCAGLAVALAITREGTEILLYLSGFWQQKKILDTVIAGSLIGFGIGISTGILLYYTLQALSEKWRFNAALILLALFSGNMLSQAVQLLTQADWISSNGALWDTSQWLAENTISGQLLYALIGYEATPSGIQVLAYICGVSLILGMAYVGTGLPDSEENKCES